MKIIRRYIISIAVLLFGSDAAANPVISTQDWERRDILTSPSERGETIIEQKQQGQWHADGFVGNLNYVLSDAGNDKRRLYVQWFNNAGELAYSVSVREFNVQPEYSIQMPVCANPECTRATINAEHVFEEVKQRFVIELTSLGRYNIGLHKPLKSD